MGVVAPREKKICILGQKKKDITNVSRESTAAGHISRVKDQNFMVAGTISQRLQTTKPHDPTWPHAWH